MTTRTIKNTKRGDNLIGLIVAMAIFGLVIASISTFQLSVFKEQKIASERSKAQQELLFLLRGISKELRTARSSATGSFTLETAQSQQITFYSDATDDGTIERIRYFFDNGTLKRGVVQPTGNPAIYNPASETVSTVAENVRNNPLFTYYDDTFNGATQTTPMPSPISLGNVRVVKIEVTVDPKAPNAPPAYAATHITIRNLREF